MELLIAATALTYNVTPVTDNVQHFQKIEGLKIKN
jgi:predicted nucleic acid-binding protein